MYQYPFIHVHNKQDFQGSVNSLRFCNGGAMCRDLHFQDLQQWCWLMMNSKKAVTRSLKAIATGWGDGTIIYNNYDWDEVLNHTWHRTGCALLSKLLLWHYADIELWIKLLSAVGIHTVQYENENHEFDKMETYNYKTSPYQIDKIWRKRRNQIFPVCALHKKDFQMSLKGRIRDLESHCMLLCTQ